jgi:hypothetical protein
MAAAEVAFAEGSATMPRPPDLVAAVREVMYGPRYRRYV